MAPAVAPAPGESPPSASVAPPAPAALDGYDLVVEVTRTDGVPEPSRTLCLAGGEPATAGATRPTEYVADFDTRWERKELVVERVTRSVEGGWTVRLIAGPCDDDPACAAIGFRVEWTLLEPMRRRSFSAVRGGEMIEIQLPRTETAEVTGGRRVRVGDRVELARLPLGAQDATFWLRVGRCPRPDAPKATTRVRPPVRPEDDPDYILRAAYERATSPYAAFPLEVEFGRMIADEEPQDRFVCGTVTDRPPARSDDESWWMPCGSIVTTAIRGTVSASRSWRFWYVRDFRVRAETADPVIAAAGGRFGWGEDASELEYARLWDRRRVPVRADPAFNLEADVIRSFELPLPRRFETERDGQLVFVAFPRDC